VVLTIGGRRKGLASLLILITRELWNEKNARIFKNKVPRAAGPQRTPVFL
jgi:hypothetical protein